MTQISRSDDNPDADPNQVELFEAIHHMLVASSPHGLQVEVLAQFVEDVISPYWDGDYQLSANGALIDWDC